MTLIYLLSILLISTICQSFKPNSYNGRYFVSRHGNNKKNIMEKPLREQKRFTTNYPKTQRKFKTITTTTTQNPLRKTENVFNNNLNSPYITPYKSGAISNILNRYGPIPNQFGNYQSEIKYEYPTTTTEKTTTTTLIPVVTATFLQSEILHPNRKNTSELNPRFSAGQNTKQLTPALVRAASLNSKVYDRPENQTIQPIPSTTAPFHYDQTIVHYNEAENKDLPYIRKQRNLNSKENSQDFIENHTDIIERGDENSTVYSKESKEKNEKNYNESLLNEDNTKDESSLAEISDEQPQEHREMRYYHDIFLNYPEPHHANYGHVENKPNLFEKRFESLKEGKRYKGEILWKDDKGGYAQHHWDLALGKL